MKIEFLENIRRKDPAARGYLEIILCYPGVHALFLHRVAHFLYCLSIPVLPRLVAHFSRILTGIEIHPAVRIGKNLFIDHGFGVVIGATATIGNNVSIYQNVTLGGRSVENKKRHPDIGDNVIIGAGANILGPINIGAGAKIGANSTVIHNVAKGQIIVASVSKELAQEVDDIEYYI